MSTIQKHWLKLEYKVILETQYAPPSPQVLEGILKRGLGKKHYTIYKITIETEYGPSPPVISQILAEGVREEFHENPRIEVFLHDIMGTKDGVGERGGIRWQKVKPNRRLCLPRMK